MALQGIYLLIEAMKAYFTAYLRAFSFTTYYPKYLTIFLKANSDGFIVLLA